MEIKIPWSMPDFGEEEREAILDVYDSGWVTMGEKTELFEKELAKVLHSKYVVAVNNGTSAIMAALLAGRPLDKCVIPAYTYKATENAVLASGIKHIIYGRVDRDTCLMNPRQVKEKTKQIPVHYAGLPLDPEMWDEESYVIEDAAESFGSELKHSGVPTYDRMKCYSFHAAKVISTIEGGCVATDNPSLYFNLKLVRCHGENPYRKGEFIRTGLNLKPNDITSAIGLEQLKKLPRYLDNRERIVKHYREELDGLVKFQEIPNYVKRHANMMFPIFIDNPHTLYNKLHDRGVDTRLGWIPLAPYENAQYIYEHVLCLPIFNTMTQEQAQTVSDEVKKCLK